MVKTLSALDREEVKGVYKSAKGQESAHVKFCGQRSVLSCLGLGEEFVDSLGTLGGGGIARDGTLEGGGRSRKSQ